MAVRRIIATLFLAALAIPARSSSDSSVAVGKASIALPGTAALTRSDSGPVREFAQNTLTPGKRLLAVWTDSQQSVTGGRYFPGHYRYAISYTMSALEHLNATTANFLQVKRAMRADFADVQRASRFEIPNSLEQLRANLRSQNIDPDNGIAPAGPAVVQLLADRDNQLSYLLLQPVRAATAGSGEAKKWLLLCSNALLIRGKVVQVNVLSEFTNAADRTWVAEECTNLTRAILSSN